MNARKIIEELVAAIESGDGASKYVMAAARAFLTEPEAEPVAWVGPLNQLMPDRIYQAWSKEYSADAVGYRPLILKDTP
jgi:hypothetical protein